MDINYTPLRHTPLNVSEMYAFHEKKTSKKQFDGVFISLSAMTLFTLATIIYTILEKRLITGL